MKRQVKWVNVFIALLLLIVMLLPSSVSAIGIIVKIKDGNLYFSTISTMDTTGTKYVTTGWLVYRQPRCNSDKSVCNPKTTQYGEITDDGKWTKVDLDNQPYDGQVTTKFTIPAALVTKALQDAGMDDLSDGGTVYLSSVFQVQTGNTLLPTKYYSLSAIRNAEPWSSDTMADFPQYYDIQAAFGSPDYEVDAVYYDTSGNPINTYSVGNFKAGAKASHTFEDYITVNGNRYKLNQSYTTTIKDPSKHNTVKSSSDPTVNDQSVNTSVGGNRLVGVYGEAPPPPPPTSAPDRIGQDLDPQASAVIKADQRGGELFDVAQGIPTSESLYTNAFAKDYLYDYDFHQVAGQKPYQMTLTKTYNLTWQQQTGTDTNGNPTYSSMSSSTTRSQTVTVYRNYSYWEIAKLDALGIKNAVLNNYALPNETHTILPESYTPINVQSTVHTDAEHLVDPTFDSNVTLPDESVDGGTGGQPAAPSEDFTGEAESRIGKIKVRNDKLTFDNKLIMDDNQVEETTTDPADSLIVPGQKVGPDVLYDSGLQIKPDKKNARNAPSTGTMNYFVIDQVNSNNNDRPYPISGINSVTIHTPVIDYPSITDDKPHNQKTTPNATRDALILERPFTVSIPTYGTHSSIPGYHDRDFQKYTSAKQVYFPFDVYVASDMKFVPKNTWIQFPDGDNQMEFYLPVWDDEGNYTVSTRTIAINAPNDNFNPETGYNKDIANYGANPDTGSYVATNTVNVEVIGRVYDFHVTDVADYNWQSVFRKSDGVTPKGASYWVGKNDIDGSPSGTQNPYVLPIQVGSNPIQGKQNVSVKTGYHIKFDLLTKGNMFGPTDGIRITPSFYFVDKNGQNRRPVDLYYQTKDNPFVKIGSSSDKEKRYVILNTPLRDVPTQELTDTATYLYDNYLNATQRASQSLADYTDSYMRTAQKPSWVGNYDMMILTQQVRTFIGPKAVPAGVDVERANAARQKWYGEYSLPAAPYIVPAGTDLASYAKTHVLDDKSDIFLHGGYIIVNFNIETIQNQDVDHPHLQYIYGPLDNQWQMEGYTAGGSIKDGDVVLYDADRSSRDDFGNGGTH